MKALRNFFGILFVALALFAIPLSATYVKASENPQYGGVLKMIASFGTKALGAPHEGDVLYRYYGKPAMESLLERNINGEFLPCLATSWEIAPDNLSITFNIRKGVNFHDGTDLNAEAVKANLEKVPRGTLKERMKSIDILDDYTLRFNLKQPDNSIFMDFSMESSMIASPTAMAKPTTPENRAKDHMVGTGPFTFVSWERDNYIKFKKFDGYWQKGKPYLDGIEFIFIADPVTAKIAFESGAGQLIMNASARDAEELKAKGYEIITVPFGLRILVPDGSNADSPLSKLKVRQAMGYAIDREAIAKAIGLGYWIPVTQAALPEHPTAFLEDVEGFKYDPERAKKLLAEAGYPNGFKTRIIAKTNENKDVITAFQNYFSEIGVETKIDLCDRGRWAANNKEGWQNGMMFATMNVTTNGPLNVRLQTGHWPYFKSIFSPPNFDENWDASMATFDDKEIAEYTKRIYNQIYNYATVIPLYVQTQIGVQTKKVHDTGWCTVDFSYISPANAWLSK